MLLFSSIILLIFIIITIIIIAIGINAEEKRAVFLARTFEILVVIDFVLGLLVGLLLLE